jgi:hypothetical protein
MGQNLRPLIFDIVKKVKIWRWLVPSSATYTVATVLRLTNMQAIVKRTGKY